MITVDFLFDIDTMVTTPLGTTGIIFGCVFDNTRIKQYWVKTINGDQYYREDQLKAVEEK